MSSSVEIFGSTCDTLVFIERDHSFLVISEHWGHIYTTIWCGVVCRRHIGGLNGLGRSFKLVGHILVTITYMGGAGYVLGAGGGVAGLWLRAEGWRWDTIRDSGKHRDFGMTCHFPVLVGQLLFVCPFVCTFDTSCFLIKKSPPSFAINDGLH